MQPTQMAFDARTRKLFLSKPPAFVLLKGGSYMRHR